MSVSNLVGQGVGLDLHSQEAIGDGNQSIESQIHTRHMHRFAKDIKMPAGKKRHLKTVPHHVAKVKGPLLSGLDIYTCCVVQDAQLLYPLPLQEGHLQAVPCHCSFMSHFI
jgi:hypothetical protein